MKKTIYTAPAMTIAHLSVSETLLSASITGAQHNNVTFTEEETTEEGLAKGTGEVTWDEVW